jgi:ATP-binding cassette, subfamily B, bacterial PglK
MTKPGPASEPQSTRTLLLGIWGHLSRRRRIQLGLLLVVMLASGGAELVSLGAVLPFLAVLSASTSTDQEADRRGFPLSRQVRQPGGWFVPLIPCSA